MWVDEKKYIQPKKNISEYKNKFSDEKNVQRDIQKNFQSSITFQKRMRYFVF